MQQYMGVLLTTDCRTQNPSRKITSTEYQNWKKQSMFDALQGIGAGKSFCEQFDIEDALLYYNALKQDLMDDYIKETYVR